ncbi:MAG: hypothetical protein JWN76_1824 [Chitinophagaceae bacterium]|nr:hypothetical protein [Chitinophagaceae bacterium]
MLKKTIVALIFVAAVFINFSKNCIAQSFIFKNNRADKLITFGNEKIKLTLDYNNKANISSLNVNGKNVIESNTGVYSQIKTSTNTYSSLALISEPKIAVTSKTVKISDITYGDKNIVIKESWKFTITTKDIEFYITRNISKPFMVEEASLPTFIFNNINTWEGAYQDYGGLAWFYLFNEKLATYGVHSNSSRFWNSQTGNGLKVWVDEKKKQVAMKYSRTNDDKLSFSITVSDKQMIPRFDSGTNRRRFIRQRTDVWAPYNMPAGNTSESITLSYFDFNDEFGRGKFVGVNGQQVSSVLNTIARIGVIDKQHFGGNSWHTPYGPICLHEQYIAQMGLAINDNTYLKGYQDCLDFYRDNAIKPDGRVWPRWAYNNVDIMKGQVTDKGFYEAQWGFLLDSNPDLVTNVAELYDQTGNKIWVKRHQLSCEKALDWIIRRDSDGDGLVEMMTDSYKEKRGSDWIDIIWAAYENAFVNAKLYHALIKWCDVEKQLGNWVKAREYETFANKLKTSFNKTTSNGGFWDEEKKCYVHWLDKDKTVHGRGLVTPVNFMAIAYGICDDSAKRRTILDEIESQMQREKLFFWPLTMHSYAAGEGNDWQFPFPGYENGDIFLSWGSVAVKAYADFKPEIALKYVKNVMSQHNIDGLAFQRYGRERQNGLGDDILSGNSLSVVGLYQAIYGINPKYNRFYLNPHITPELAGTELNYNFRGQKLKISLMMNRYAVATNKFKIIADKDFSFYSEGDELSYFDGSNAKASFKISASDNSNITIDIIRWDPAEMQWIETSTDKKPKKMMYTFSALSPNANYQITENGKVVEKFKSTPSGSFLFNHAAPKGENKIMIRKGQTF